GGAWSGGGGWNGGRWNGEWIGDWSRWNGIIRQQLNAIQNRLAAGSITRADLEALREIVPRNRYLPRETISDRDDLIKSVDNLELAALAAVEKSRVQAASRAGASTENATPDNETVAEYYRRLGR